MSPGDAPASQAAADDGAAAANPAPAGREFSEQAVAPAAKPGAPASPPAASPGGAAAAGATRPPRSLRLRHTGTLIVRSTPSGAGVTVNGRWRGRTPLTLGKLPLRSYDVRVVQPGFEAATESSRLTSGTPRAIARAASAAERLAPRRAPAAPPRAAGRPPRSGGLYRDRSTSTRGRAARASASTASAVGVTPLRVPDVRIGTHVVRLELPDHRIWSSTATVTAGQEPRVTGSLERIQ